MAPASSWGARSQETNQYFEMVLEWKHHTHAGNSGVFLWCPEEAFIDLPPGKLPRSGIEVQVLDLGYEENWEQSKMFRSDWFTSHGDCVGDPQGLARRCTSGDRVQLVLPP
ncbi:MAG: hypothetical protein KDB53_16575 [Planctomycetes bacterium]|nr:hypothetical protein [Planctomycetota bacterium]